LIKSKGEKLCLELNYALFLVSKAKLYTNLLLPICLAINSFCELVGEILYLYALNIVQIYNYFKQKTNIVKKNILSLQDVSVTGVAYIPPTQKRLVGFTLRIIKSVE